jgi:hypothetical protein
MLRETGGDRELKGKSSDVEECLLVFVKSRQDRMKYG